MDSLSEYAPLLNDQGFVHIPGVVPLSVTQALLEAIRDRFHLDTEDPASWSQLPSRNFGIVPMHHHQAQWNLRQHPAVYEAFRSLHRDSQLTVCPDRPSFHPPQARVPFAGAHHTLHWDFDPGSDHREVQGLVYLTDTSEEAGAFRCSPEVYSNRSSLASFNPFSDPNPIDLSGVGSIAVPGMAGDLVVWMPQLPHCAGPSQSSRPRVTQIVSMFPGVPRAEREQWARWLTELRAPPWWRGLEGQSDPEPGPPPTLTDLGRRLAGLDRWPTRGAKRRLTRRCS